MREPLSNPKNRVVTVIGAGPAGLTAGLYAARAGLAVTVLEKLTPGGQMNLTPEIENYPGAAGSAGWELAERMHAQAAAAGAVIRTAEVLGLNLGGARPVVRTAREEESCDALILAMGAAPRKLDIGGEAALTGRGVSYCAVCDGAFFKDKRAAVVGGGNTALEDALYLSGLCAEVTLIHRRDAFRGEAALVERVRQDPRIRLLLSAVPEEITGDTRVEGLRVREIKTGRIEELLLDAVFIAVGTEPQTALVRDWINLDPNGYVVAGEDTRTSHPAVFAAGDVRAKPLRQIATAVADGATAVSQITGE